MDAIDYLFSTNKPIALIIFGALALYVLHDLLKKSSRMDTLIDKVTEISNSLLLLTKDFHNEKEGADKTERDIKELQKDNGKIRHRLAKVETRLQLKDIQNEERQ